MGFESAHAARRRLAMLAMTNDHVHEALTQDGTAGLSQDRNSEVAATDRNRSTLAFRASSDGSQLTFPSFPASTSTLPERAQADHGVAAHLDQLAHDIVQTPGAGGALLVAFAAQARALSLVVEAARRSSGASTLPAEVLAAVQNALRTPMPMGLELA